MKKIFSIFAAILFAGSMSAANIVFSGADFTGGTPDTGSAFGVSKNGVTVSSDKAYGTGEELRVYQGGKLLVSAGTVKITKIVAEFTDRTKGTFDAQTPNAPTWQITADKQFRISKLTVTIDGEAGDDDGSAVVDDGGDEGEVCEVSATGKWSFVEAYYDFYQDGTVDINLFTTAGWFFDEEGNLYGAGAGSVAVFDIAPDDQSNLVGTYTVDEGTLDPEYCYFVEYASDDDDEGTVHELKSGSVTIALNDKGTAYTLTYNLTFTDSSTATGTVNNLCLVGGEEEGIENTTIESNVTKTIKNGQLMIIKNGVQYNAQGVVVR